MSPSTIPRAAGEVRASFPIRLKPLLYIGIQRGGNRRGVSYPGGNCFLAVFDLAGRRYVADLYLAEVENGRSDDSTPICLTYDEKHACLFVGMFQSLRGICRIDELGREILDDFRFVPNATKPAFPLGRSSFPGPLSGQTSFSEPQQTASW